MKTRGISEYANFSKIARFALLPAGLILSNPLLALNEFQSQQLFKPSVSQLLAEEKGKVMIYDRVDENTIDSVMTNQFDRIDNMMFVRIQFINESGETEVFEDGCD